MDADDDKGFNASPETISEKPLADEGENVDEKNNYYDFQAFLKIMREPKADPIVKYTKSFIRNFVSQRENWTTSEQEKLINDFKVFIYDKLLTNEAFRDLSDAQIKNAKEGIEKLVMGKLYYKCFSPCLVNEKRSLDATHEQDLLDDAKLRDKILEFRFLGPEHLDIIPDLINGKLHSFIALSAKELAKINQYRSPRDKMVCVLNSCKVLFGLLKHNNKLNGGADHFVPLLIFTLLKSDVPHLISNVRYIERFRFPSFLMGENAYYLSTLQGAVNFILDMDIDSISILETDKEFNKKYSQNQEEIKDLKKQELLNPKDSSSKLPHHTISPSPSEYILKPLDDAANSVLTKLNDFWNTSTSPTPSSPEYEDRSPRDHQEIDEHTATVLAQQMEHKEHENTLQTLQLMFPDLDPDLIQDVCIASKYRVGVCVDSLLEMAE
ncbi:Vps9 [Kluyveromyces lactis]|nr:Vps9 [Kluyveromyces lactis]